MAGYIYRIAQDRSYTDLDELIVNYVKAIARKVEELMADEKYKHESPDQLSEYLSLVFRVLVTDSPIQGNRSSCSSRVLRTRACMLSVWIRRTLGTSGSCSSRVPNLLSSNGLVQLLHPLLSKSHSQS